MTATTITTRPPAPAEIARATAVAIPTDISTRPILGIVGVLIGAGLVTLTGRMLSLGLADLKGHVGISYDQGAWLDSAYNASIMFIGPFSVYVGGLLGPRRVLLFAAGVFAITCAFLPLIHSYSLLIAALIVAGLTSGTFYPLTLTFALRISPLRYLPFTMAFYATFIDGGGQHSAVALRLVSRTSFLALDVLEFSLDCAGDDDLYLSRDTESSSTEQGQSGTQLRRIPVPQCGISSDAGCPPAG